MSDLRLSIRHETGGFSLAVEQMLPLRGVTALFGPSGSGKTTLLDAIAGLRRDLDSVELTVDGQCWQDESNFVPPWQRGVAYVFQDARLFPHLTVAGNLAYAEKRAFGPGPARDDVVQWLGIDGLLQRDVQSLSAGQQQRVAIARALLRGPRLLLLDEPLANLDRNAASECLACLQRIARESATPMIYVSHQIEEVCAIADHLLMLDQGRVTAAGPLLELASNLDTQLALEDSAAALLRVEVGEQDTRYDLTELRVDGQSLWVSATSVRSRLRRLRIPARDVSICRELPAASSILNVLPVTITDMRDLGPAHCLLRLELQEQFLLARITRRSRDQLALQVGDPVYAQIKSTALLGDEGP